MAWSRPVAVLGLSIAGLLGLTACGDSGAVTLPGPTQSAPGTASADPTHSPTPNASASPSETAEVPGESPSTDALPADPQPSESSEPSEPTTEAWPPPGAIDDPRTVIVVVNKHRALNPVDYEPDLVLAGIATHWNEPWVRPETAAAIEAMNAAMIAETGSELITDSAYRSYWNQVDLYGRYAAADGEAVADTYSARAGHSEHQTGLAMDISTWAAAEAGCSSEQCFGDMPDGLWVEANAHRFGFIVRYPRGGESITGYIWEPWHLRYVGVDVATDMHDRGIATLEEYFNLEPAPGYL